MDPFTKIRADSISSLGEIGLLNIIREWLGEVTPPTPFGMGDDCALLRPRETTGNLLTVDGLLYGQHFDNSISPKDVGAKMLKRSISDIAAMGGSPKFAVLGLFLPGNLARSWLEGFYFGLRDAAKQWEVSILGGDVTQSEGTLGGYLTLFGYSSRPLTRNGGRQGDSLLVTGTVGGSLLGKHFDFSPRLREAQWLAQDEAVRSMIDLTDGLSKDLPELLPRGSRATIDTNCLPISEAANTLADRTGRTALEHALNDGEDYELLFALSAKVNPKTFIEKWSREFTTPLSHIGEIVACPEESTEEPIVDSVTGKPLSTGKGYEYFIT